MTNPTLLPNPPVVLANLSVAQKLSLSKNPLLATCSHEELVAMVQALRQAASSQATLAAELRSESSALKPKTALSSKRKSALDAI